MFTNKDLYNGNRFLGGRICGFRMEYILSLNVVYGVVDRTITSDVDNIGLITGSLKTIYKTVISYRFRIG